MDTLSKEQLISAATKVPEAEWSDDCSGKKNYDGTILSINTRYWGRGGSAIVFQGGQFASDRHSPSRQRIKPSAKSSIMLQWKADEEGDTYDPGYVNLVEQDFEAETEQEVKQLVEQWAKQQFQNIVKLLQQNYGHTK